MGDNLAAINQPSETKQLPESVQELRKWKILKNLPQFLLCRVQYAAVTKRQEGGDWYDYALMVTRDDNVYVIGDNRSGQLGISADTGNIDGPIQVKELSGLGIIGFSTSWHNVAAWTIDGKIFIMGENREGELGQGHSNQITGPRQVVKGLNSEFVVKAACGGHHTICLTKAGDVYTWGKNYWHQTSPATESFSTVPYLVEFPDINIRVVDIDCTVETSFALTADGKVYGWGANKFGQVGIGSTQIHVLKPTQIYIPGGQRIKSIACGYSHSMVLTTGGLVFTWGKNNRGQLGDGNREPVRVPTKIDVAHVTSISAYNGLSASFCKVVPGYVCVWGHFTIAVYPYCTEYENLNDFLAANDLGMCKNWACPSFKRKSAKELDLYSYLVEASQRRTVPFSVEGTRIMASKLCLKRSGYIQQKLKDEWKQQLKALGEIKIEGVKSEVFESFIDYLHTDSLEASDENLVDLLKLARLYKMKRFHEEVIQLISSNINTENAVRFYSTAVETNDSALGLVALDYIKPRASEILNTVNLDTINPNIMIKIMQDIKGMGAFK